MIDRASSDNSNDGVSKSSFHSDGSTPARVAKKSTATTGNWKPPPPTPAIVTRRQSKMRRRKLSAKEKFMENFDPERSVREKRKLSRKFNASYASSTTTTARRIPGAVYDENGIHTLTGSDLCDCLQKCCSGCHFPCPKCKSLKCGSECRVQRKFIYDQIEYHGCDLTIKNPLGK